MTPLPNENHRIYLTDGGQETTFIFRDRLELPHFASFHLLRTPEGREIHRRYYRNYARLAQKYDVGILLESCTFRASRDWGDLLGYDPTELALANLRSINLLRIIQSECDAEGVPSLVSGCIGPRGDGYVPGKRMTVEEAASYHAEQAATLAEAGVDFLTAMTMNYVEEAQGIARAAKQVGARLVISFTVETDGRLPTGQSLAEAIETIDRDTEEFPAYYMINCAHPTHFAHLFDGSAWNRRIGGIRGNASAKSHAELNDSTELDAGDPADFGRRHVPFMEALPQLRVIGGCCGTDQRHVDAVFRELATLVS